MAPAGSFETLSAALRAGCDSVYFGVGHLNMRARSGNRFVPEDLPKITRLCRRAGVHTYLTLNTVVYDEELPLMKETIRRAADAGVTAIIATDPEVIQEVRKAGLPVHISTQCNITNLGAVRFYAQWADVMVLARELSLEQVGAIARAIERDQIKGPSGRLVRLEVFVHGALCMAVSGKCYLSLHAQNQSANRGSCIQNCRRSYLVRDRISDTELEVENEYIMSAGDLCTIGFLDKIRDAGISLLKIEGRGRSADYVHTVVQCYREALVSLENGTYTRERVAEWEEQLARVFNRGFWDGYYLGRTMGQWSHVHGSRATRRKLFVGPCENYYVKPGVAVFRVQAHDLQAGDEILVTGPTTGAFQARAEGMRVDDREVQKVHQGELVAIRLGQRIRRSDKLYKLVEADRE